MPNGQSGAGHLLQLERLFAPIADILESFRERHNLDLEKYYHEEPSWSFTFRHPSGGIGKISVLRSRLDELDLDCSWWYDDYDTMTRHIRRSRKEHLSAEVELIHEELERFLKLILSWKFGSWDEIHSGNKAWQKMWSREQFLHLLEKYPIPKATNQ
jgi:hypothetical protein